MRIFQNNSESKIGRWRKRSPSRLKERELEKRLKSPKARYTIPNNPNDIKLDPRIDLNTIIESNDKASDEAVLYSVSLWVDLSPGGTVWDAGIWWECEWNIFPCRIIILCKFCNIFHWVNSRLPLWLNPGRAAPLGRGTTGSLGRFS